MRLPIIKVRYSKSYALLMVGYAPRVAERFHLSEDKLLDHLLTDGFALLGPYVFTLA